MPLSETAQRAIAIALVLGVPLIAWGTLRLRSALDRQKRRGRAKRAQRGELRARSVLRRAGYTIVGEQVRNTAHYFVDGEKRSAVVVADFIAKKWGRRYVVEVKTGKARSADAPATRRQLLEYQRVFKVDALLLIGGAEPSLKEIRFERPRTGWWWLVPLGAAILFLILTLNRG